MKKILFIICILFCGISGYAQVVFSGTAPKVQRREDNKYPLNWFVGIGGGINKSVDFKQSSTQKTGWGTGLSLEAYAGKWFTRAVGARVGYLGVNTSFNDVNLSSNDHGSHPFLYAHADVLFRPATWLVPYVHGGYFRVKHWGADGDLVSKSALGAGAGLLVPIRAGRIRIAPGICMIMMNGGVLSAENVPLKRMRFMFSATTSLAWTFGQ